MNFADFLRLRQQGNPPPPVGPFPGDRRMDQVEAQRAGQYGQGVYGINPAPGYICFEDGSCVSEEEYAARQRSGAIGGRMVVPQRDPNQRATPGMGSAFLQYLLSRQNGEGAPIRTQPSPSPSMDPRNVVCDENGQNCRPVYMR